MEVARRALWELERLPRVYEVEGRKGTLALNVSRTGGARPPNIVSYHRSWKHKAASEVMYWRRLVEERWRHHV